jgi:hypothetical protein
MSVYSTPFDLDSMQWTGESIDSGFESLADVVISMPSIPPVRDTRSIVVYHTAGQGVAFSHLILRVDGDGNSGYPQQLESEITP